MFMCYFNVILETECDFTSKVLFILCSNFVCYHLKFYSCHFGPPKQTEKEKACLELQLMFVT